MRPFLSITAMTTLISQHLATNLRVHNNDNAFFLMKIGNIYLSNQYSYTNTQNSYVQATTTMPIKGNLPHLSKFQSIWEQI